MKRNTAKVRRYQLHFAVLCNQYKTGLRRQTIWVPIQAIIFASEENMSKLPQFSVPNLSHFQNEIYNNNTFLIRFVVKFKLVNICTLMTPAGPYTKEYSRKVSYYYLASGL